MAVDAAAATCDGNRCPGREGSLTVAGQLFKLRQSIRDAFHDLCERQIDILAEIDRTHTTGCGQPRVERKRRFAQARRVMEGRWVFVVPHLRYV